MKRGFLSNAFAFVVNAGVIGGIKASAAATVALNPFGLGAIATIAATAVVSGIAISGYKKWRHDQDWNTFGKNVLTHSAFGMVGGGLGFFGEDYIAPLFEKISGYFNWSAAPVLQDSQDFELQGQAEQSLPAEQNPAGINMGDTDEASQRVAQAHELTKAMPDMDEAVPQAVVPNDPVIDYEDYELPPLAVLPSLEGDEVMELFVPPDDISARVAQAHELTKAMPDMDEAVPQAVVPNDPVIDYEDYELPPLAVLPSLEGDEVMELFVPPDNISARIVQAHELTPVIPNMDEAVPQAVAASDPVIDYEDYEVPPLAMLPPIAIPEVFESVMTDIPDGANPLTGAFNDNNMDLEIVTGNPLHIVEEGDNLWAIAEQEYGDGEMYRVIVQANLEKYPELLEHPDLIQPDMELVIPPADAPPADCVTGNVQSNRPTICAPALQLAA